MENSILKDGTETAKKGFQDGYGSIMIFTKFTVDHIRNISF
jgi:hypothetical protein